MELTPRQKQADAAKTLASSYELVQYSTTTYRPAHWETELSQPLPVPEQRVWLPLSKNEKRRLGNLSSKILFQNDSEVSSFAYMLGQLAIQVDETPQRLLIRTPEGLKVLTETGELVESDGTFLPNFIRPRLNTEETVKKEVFDIIAEWVESEDEAHSLLYHLATCLAPGWSAVKYILLLGDGRNGKSLLIDMLCHLFGEHNVSHVSRQQMAEKLPVCTELNGKLLNAIYDGQQDYIKDSGPEKTLVAGEAEHVRLLYESGTTRVQTNALFIEGLNKEPKSRDKGTALQKRMVRFRFPREYPFNSMFRRYMLSEPMLGAFLGLLLDHYVQEHEAHDKLQLSALALALQQDQMLVNSPMLQFLDHTIVRDPAFAKNLTGAQVDAFIGSFMAWRLTEGYDSYSTADVMSMMTEHFVMRFKTVRENGKTPKKRIIDSIKPGTATYIKRLLEKGDDGGDEDIAELVED